MCVLQVCESDVSLQSAEGPALSVFLSVLVSVHGAVQSGRSERR